jgi:hypothetical protein
VRALRPGGCDLAVDAFSGSHLAGRGGVVEEQALRMGLLLASRAASTSKAFGVEC